MMANTSFGHGLLPEFLLEEGFTNLNHGSFGALPRDVMQDQHRLVELAESRPDDWFRGGYQTILGKVRGQLANYIRASPDDVVFVENASAAINAVLRSLLQTPSDTVLLLTCAYAMVSNTVTWLQAQGRGQLLQVNIDFPIKSEDDVINAVRAALQDFKISHPERTIKLAIFSHIVSIPALRLPVGSLTELCKSNGVEQVMIDGAHALGQIDINITALAEKGVDYYTGNGHKWLYCPKGTAFLWTRVEHHRETTPTVVSSDWAPHDYMRDFMYTGTRDYTPYASVEAAFAFRDKIGGDAAIRKYMRDLTHAASNMLVDMWKTQLAGPLDMSDAMITVQLPTQATAIAPTLMTTLARDYDTQIVVYEQKSFSGGASTWWVRLSSQVYVELADFERVGRLVLQLSSA